MERQLNLLFKYIYNATKQVGLWYENLIDLFRKRKFSSEAYIKE